jgi:hypothetical protein
MSFEYAGNFFNVCLVVVVVVVVVVGLARNHTTLKCR